MREIILQTVKFRADKLHQKFIEIFKKINLFLQSLNQWLLILIFDLIVKKNSLIKNKQINDNLA